MALLAHWKFDDGSGNNATDSSGNSLTGSLSGAQTWITGAPNGPYGISFDGSADIMTVTHTTLNPTSLSIAFWARVPSAASAQRIMELNGVTGYVIRVTTNVAMEIVTLDGVGTFFASGDNSLEVGRWHHWVITAGSGGGKWYRDGNEIASVGTAYTGSGYTSTLYFSPSGNQFTGDLDDVRIYNAVLTATEVHNLYTSQQISIGGGTRSKS